MPNFDKPNDIPKNNSEDIVPINRAGEDEAPHASDKNAPAIAPERAKEFISKEEEIINALINLDCYDPNTLISLSEWEKALRDKLYLEKTGKVSRENIDSLVHEEFQKLEMELFNEALNGIQDEIKRQRLINFIEEKRKV